MEENICGSIRTASGKPCTKTTDKGKEFCNDHLHGSNTPYTNPDLGAGEPLTLEEQILIHQKKDNNGQ